VSERECEVVVIAFADELTISLPAERARRQVRALIGVAELNQIVETLRGDVVCEEESWRVRERDARAKLTAGEALGLAEIIRDGSARTRSRSNTNPELSASERVTLAKARKLLAREISHTRGVELAEADDWIGQQLAAGPYSTRQILDSRSLA
jgi:RNA polymerase-interacting CarD/CdnL/TRCF family regulator